MEIKDNFNKIDISTGKQQFIIEKEFWNLFPTSKIGVIICRGISNKVLDIKKYETLLALAGEKSLQYTCNEDFASNDVIKTWREAYKKFKTKSGARSSIESLLKRVKKGNNIPCINPLVDLYNYISLKYAFPCGGEDLDKIKGDLKLGMAFGDEFFLPLGEVENIPPIKGEVIYKDEEGAICRCLNWREAQRTMLTESTQNAFLCIELIEGSREKEFEEALNELELLIKNNLGGSVTKHILTSEMPNIFL